MDDHEASILVLIPTYNRFEVAADLVDSLVSKVSDHLRVLIVQDGTGKDPAGPNPALLDLAKQDGIELVFREESAGYSAAMITAVESTGSDYLLLTADDDFIDPEAISRIQARLSHSPCQFLSTQFRRQDGTLGRNTVKDPRSIGAGELAAAANHAPGLIFQVEALRDGPINVLARLLAEQNEAAYVYPQKILLAELLFSGQECLWWPDAPVIEGYRLPSDFTDAKDRRYWDADSRLYQAIDFLGYLADASRRHPGSPKQRGVTSVAAQKAATALAIAIEGHIVSPFPDYSERQTLRRFLMRRLFIETVQDRRSNG